MEHVMSTLTSAATTLNPTPTETGNVDEEQGGDKYDEAGYIALPPCLWGDDPGLQPSVLLPPNTELVSIKKNKNTYMGHYGEMASWQMRGVFF